MAWKAGLLAVLVHVMLVGILLFSFQWKAAHTVVSVSEVELWDTLPSKSQSVPKPVPPVVEPKPEPPTPTPEPPKAELKKEPEPKVEPKPEPEQPKVDIELENKKKKEAEQKKVEEKKKAEEEKKKLAEKKAEEQRKKQLEAIKKAMLEEEPVANNKAKEDALKKLQQMNDEDLGGADEKAASAASQGIVDEYIAKIQAKVRGNVNKSLCVDGNPELAFKISLLPNGEFISSPTLTKSSGSKACDDAVERAIIASEPFPLPQDSDALAKFRNLNLKFRPNDE